HALRHAARVRRGIGGEFPGSEEVKMTRSLHITWALLLVGLLVGVVAINRAIVNGRTAPVTEGDLRRGFRFEEVAAARGVRFTHTAPTFDARLAHIMPQVASMGAAVSIVDIDGDGWQDLYVTNSGEGSA